MDMDKLKMHLKKASVTMDAKMTDWSKLEFIKDEKMRGLLQGALLLLPVYIALSVVLPRWMTGMTYAAILSMMVAARTEGPKKAVKKVSKKSGPAKKAEGSQKEEKDSKE